MTVRFTRRNVVAAAAGLAIFLAALLYEAIHPSSKAAFAISAATGSLTVEPMCGDHLVWDLPPGRLARRSALPGSDDSRRGDVTLVLLPGSSVRVESTSAAALQVSVGPASHVPDCAPRGRPFFEATVDDEPVADDRAGVTYIATAEQMPAELSLLLSGHMIVGEVPQLGAGWASRPAGLLESGTVDVRILPMRVWSHSAHDSVTLRTEQIHTGSLIDTHACLDAAASQTCPDASASAARGFLQTRAGHGLSVELYSQRRVGTQSFGGEPSTFEVSGWTRLWNSPDLQAVVALAGLLLAGAKAGHDLRVAYTDYRAIRPKRGKEQPENVQWEKAE